MNLHRVPPAQGDLRTPFSRQVWEFPAVAGLAAGPGLVRGHLSTVITPYVKGEQRLPQLIMRAHQKLDRLSSLDRRHQIHRAIQNARCVTRLHGAFRRGREHATQARCSARYHVHGDGIRSHRSRVNPWLALLHRKIIDQVAGFKVVRGVQNQVHSGQQRANILRRQIGDLRLSLSLRN